MFKKARTERAQGANWVATLGTRTALPSLEARANLRNGRADKTCLTEVIWFHFLHRVHGSVYRSSLQALTQKHYAFSLFRLRH